VDLARDRVALVKEGAADYLAKPWDDAKVVTTVKNMLRLRELALENHRLRAQSARARNELQDRYDLCGLVYASEAMHRVVSLAASVARADAPVLISGPNGSGKEKVAEIVHANSPRRQQPFVKVNAGGLPDDLLEAELFGAEVGAFTGATKRRIGRFEAADGGTLFLDEIGNLSLKGQMKLLRVLQTGEFERLGSTITRKVDVRIVSATNANLRQMIAAGSFREDLLFRLNVIEIRISPLRERSEDVLPLAEHFLAPSARPRASARPSARPADAASRRATSPMRITDASPSSASRAPDRRVPPRSSPRPADPLQPRRRPLACSATTGPATSASCRTASSAPSSCATAASSNPATSASTTPASPPTPSARAITPSPSPAPASSATRTPRPSAAPSSHALETHAGVVARAAAELGLSRQALYRRMDRLGISLERQLRQS
jgi:DNA-binding NtrC family response regulator